MYVLPVSKTLPPFPIASVQPRYSLIIVSPNATICRAYDASINRKKRSVTEKDKNAKSDWFRKNLPCKSSKIIFQFATQSLEDFLRYRSVNTTWVHVPVLFFLRPRLGKLNDPGCMALANICNSLSCYISDIGYDSLWYLELNGCFVTDAGLRELARLPSLLTFIFHARNDVAVTSYGLQALGDLKKLNGLFLANVCFTEPHGLSLYFLTKLQNLQKLVIFKSKITDTSFQGLRRNGQMNIKSFVLWECSGLVTTRHLVRMVRRLNKLEFFSAKFYRSDICVATLLNALPETRSVKLFYIPQSTFDCSTASSLQELCPNLEYLVCKPNLLKEQTPLNDAGFRSLFATAIARLNDRLHAPLLTLHWLFVSLCLHVVICFSPIKSLSFEPPSITH